MGSDTDRLKTGRRQSGSHIPRGLKHTIKKILTGMFVPSWPAC